MIHRQVPPVQFGGLINPPSCARHISPDELLVEDENNSLNKYSGLL